jgi:Holliday junction resolvase
LVDSRQKGARAEAAIVKLLCEKTGLNWKRVPGSGALHEDHGLKGDVYIPNEHNYWACEVKHYKDGHLTSKVLTDKDPQLLQWWTQAVRQGKQTDKRPILFFKHDRSKWFVGMHTSDLNWCRDSFLHLKHISIWPEGLVIFTFDTWVKDVLQYIDWIK